MAILFGAELGPKADPTTTTYSPRPEWYFFFLFELLRVVKPPELVFLATIGIPTICLMLLILLPFYDRSPERHPLKRPIAMVGAVATIGAMAYLTVLGALAGPPSEIEIEVAPQYEEGKEVTASSGCLGCHKIGENGNTLGPEPDRDRRPAGPGRDRAHAGEPDRADARPTPRCRRTTRSSSTSSSSFVASLKEEMPEEEGEPAEQASAEPK